MIISKEEEKVNIEDFMDLFPGSVVLDIWCECPRCNERLIQYSDNKYYCVGCNNYWSLGKFINKDISGEMFVHRGSVKTYKDIQFKTGHLTEVYQYENPVLRNYSSRSSGDYRYVPKGEGKNKELNSRRSWSRRKQRIRRLVNTNCLNRFKCSFLTLTYGENMIDQKKAYKDFKNFIKRLRYHYPQFNKYLWIAERQERGAIHFHIIFFDVPFLHYSEIVKLWGFGHIQINQLKDIKNVGCYVGAYLGKEYQKQDLTGRLWGHSENLSEYEIKMAISAIEADKNRDYSKVTYSKVIESKYRGRIYFHLFRN